MIFFRNLIITNQRLRLYQLAVNYYRETWSNTQDQVVNTGYKLFSSTECLKWTMYLHAEQRTSDSNKPVNIQCMNEAGSPYQGLIICSTGSKLFCTLNGGLNNKYHPLWNGSGMTLVQDSQGSQYPNITTCDYFLSRDGSNLYYSADGVNWTLFPENFYTFEAHEYPLIIGGHASNNYTTENYNRLCKGTNPTRVVLVLDRARVDLSEFRNLNNLPT